jgi:hypothetical protein
MVTYNELEQEPGMSKGVVSILSAQYQPLQNKLLMDKL